MMDDYVERDIRENIIVTIIKPRLEIIKEQRKEIDTILKILGSNTSNIEEYKSLFLSIKSLNSAIRIFNYMKSNWLIELLYF